MKDAETVELGPSHELAELVEFVIRLTRVAHDERCAKHQARDTRSQAFDQLAQPCATVPSAHPSKHGVRCVLERHVDVGKHRRVLTE